MGSRRVIRFLAAFGGLAAMTSLAALPLGGAGRPGAAAPQAGPDSRMVPATSNLYHDFQFRPFSGG